ncbi:hypothetical protein ACPZ19_47205 [Amycolatopsis lurida]
MQWDNVLGVAVIMGLFGLLILIPLWPGEKQGVRVLRRWGVSDPGAADVAEAVRYLRRRRFWYPWLFLGLPALATASGLDKLRDAGPLLILVTLLFGALIAEVLAQRPTRTRQREATLDPRRVRDLIPLWGLLSYVVIVAITAVWLAIGRAWPLLGVVAAVAVLTWLIVLLAVRRPSTGDSAVDRALRTRSVRVSTGLGAATTAVLAAPVTEVVTWLLLLAAVTVWVTLAGGERAVRA